MRAAMTSGSPLIAGAERKRPERGSSPLAFRALRASRDRFAAELEEASDEIRRAGLRPERQARDHLDHVRCLQRVSFLTQPEKDEKHTPPCRKDPSPFLNLGTL
jgi:hypothetical protein